METVRFDKGQPGNRLPYFICPTEHVIIVQKHKEDYK